MPNHVKSIIKISKLKKDDIDIILNLIATCSHSPEKPEDEYIIDFNKIIPEPETKDECPEDCIVASAKKAHIEEDSKRPWFDWYTWHNKYWGTKWEAYDAYTIIGKSYIQFIFSTAWSIPIPIIKKLALIGYNLNIKYADEDYGSNCGRITYSSEQGWQHENESELKDPVRFAKALWNRY